MSEKVKIKIARNVVHLPAIALRGLVVFPNNVVHFEVGRTKSIAAIEAAMHANSNIFLIAQKDMETEEPTAQHLYAYGVISEIKQVLRVSEDLVKVLVEGKSRAKLLDLDASGKYLQADVRPAPVPVCWSSTPAKSICRPRYAPWLCAASLPTSATRSRLSSAA